MLKWILLAIVLFIALRLWINKYKLLMLYNSGNVIQFGKKGKGKDVIFQKVIASKKQKYYSTMDYGGKYEHKEIIDLEISPNNFENLINGLYFKIPWQFEWGRDFYISDAGIYLPSHEDNLLSKKFQSLPITYALSRQLGEMNIHVNSQALDRIWKKLREQGTYFIKSLKTFKIRLPIPKSKYKLEIYLFTKIRTYDRYQSALDDVRKIKPKIIAADRNQIADYNARHGEIHEFWIFTAGWQIKYDTYHFRRVLVDEEHPDTKPMKNQ